MQVRTQNQSRKPMTPGFPVWRRIIRAFLQFPFARCYKISHTLKLISCWIKIYFGKIYFEIGTQVQMQMRLQVPARITSTFNNGTNGGVIQMKVVCASLFKSSSKCLPGLNRRAISDGPISDTARHKPIIFRIKFKLNFKLTLKAMITQIQTENVCWILLIL